MRFAKLDIEIAARPDLSSGAKVVYAMLLYRQGRNRKCWPSLSRLQSDTGLSRPAVVRAIEELLRARLIAVVRGNGGETNSYVL